MTNESPTSQKKTPNKETSKEVLEWAQSFHHETPPMFRRRFEEAADPNTASEATHNQVLDDSSDSAEERTAAEVTVASSRSPLLSNGDHQVHCHGTIRPTSVGSDPGPERDIEMKEARPVLNTATVAPPEMIQRPAREVPASKYRLSFGGPAYPRVRQPALPDLTNVHDPDGVAARRLTKYQSFHADDKFLQTHLYPIDEKHFGPRFHTKFFVKTIGTIMCDHCRQKNAGGEMYKCDTCTNQICSACVEERLQREEDERNNPPTDGEEPYKWEWNGKDRHEGFKLCYVERKEKANGRGDYSIPFVGIVDGKETLEGNINMIVSDIQSGRKRKDPPDPVHQQKVKLRAVKDEKDRPIPDDRAPSKERDRVQQMVFGKKSATLAKLTKIQEAATAAQGSCKTSAYRPPQNGTRPATSHRPGAQEALARQQLEQLEYDRQMYQAQMVPAAPSDYRTSSQEYRRMPVVAPPDTQHSVTAFPEAPGRRYATPPWDGRGLPPYQYDPYRDTNHHHRELHRQIPARHRTPSPPDMPLPLPRPAQGQGDSRDPYMPYTAPPPPWIIPGQPYLMTDADRFQSQMYVQQLQAQAAAIQQMQARGIPVRAAGDGTRDRNRIPRPFENPYEALMQGQPQQAYRARSSGRQPFESTTAPQRAERRPHTPDLRIKREAPADSSDPSSMLPDDPTIFIPQQYRARVQTEYTRWDALMEAANVMYELDLNELEGMAIGKLTPAQVDAVKRKAREDQQAQRQKTAMAARNAGQRGGVVVIDDDDNADTESENGRGRQRYGRDLWQTPDADGGRLRSGKEFSS